MNSVERTTRSGATINELRFALLVKYPVASINEQINEQSFVFIFASN